MSPTRTDGPARVEALLLIGHGSARYADAGRVLEAQADALRATGRFAEVGVGFLAGAPTPAEALAALSTPTIHVVPFFMEDGYFTRVALPRALGLNSPAVGDRQAVDSRSGVDEPPGVNGPTLPPPPLRGRAGEGGLAAPAKPCLISHPPIGIHPDFPALLAARIRSAITEPVQAILLLAHGSARAPGRLMAAHRHAAALRAEFPIVENAFLEEPPFVPDALARIGDRPTAVLGLFVNHGTHARDDMPALLQAARAGRATPLLDLGIIGDDPGIRALILDLVDRPPDA
jgi:sirohydrochlorin cobaltochelatase